MRYRGSGGDEDSGTQGAIDAPDTISSTQYLRVLDLWSEGPIKGLVNGGQSIYVEDTPLENNDGSLNVKGFYYQERRGFTSQEPLSQGFNEVESEKSVNVLVKNGFPITRRVESSDAKYARVTLKFPTFVVTDSKNGNTGPATVEVQISTQNNGGGFIPAAIGVENATTSIENISPFSKFTQSSFDTALCIGAVPKVKVVAHWTGEAVMGTQSVSLSLQRRSSAGGSWETIFTRTLSGEAPTKPAGYGGQAVVSGAPTLSLFYYDSTGGAPYDYKVVTNTPNAHAAALDVSKFEIFKESTTDIITEKSSGGFVKSYRIPLTGDGPHDIRVTRISGDPDTQYNQNTFYWDTYTEIIPSRMSYPNSAYCGIVVDASQYNNIPSRSYEVEGLMVNVPSNYNPTTRAYTGEWDGIHWQMAYTNNPVWCLLDLLMSSRYGLGEYITESKVDIPRFYEAAKYCDEFISDGYGGTEPRYTLNLYVQQRTGAYQLLQDIASVFNGMLYWAGGKITLSYDHLESANWIFNNANVIDGLFSYESTGRDKRFNQARVTWSNPFNGYEDTVEIYNYEPDQLVRGVKPIDAVAVGCTSRGQALRYAKNIVLTSLNLTQTVSFKTGIEGAMGGLYPGAVIKIYDYNKSRERKQGRISASSINSVTLDSPVTLVAGTVYTLSVILPTGQVEERTITNGGGSYSTISVATSFSEAPQKHSIWIIESGDVQAQQFQVISIKESDRTSYEISALQYNPTKYAAIEAGASFVPLDISNADWIGISPPEGLTLLEEVYFDEANNCLSRVVVQVRQHTSSKFKEWKGYWRYPGGSWNAIPSFSTTTTSIQPIALGNIEVKLEAVSINGIHSSTRSASLYVRGSNTPPADVTGLTVNTTSGVAYLMWDQPSYTVVPVSHYVVKFTTESPSYWNNATTIAPNVSAPCTFTSIPSLKGYYLVKAVDRAGNVSNNAAIVENTSPTLEDYNVVETIMYSPSWAGILDNCRAVNGNLSLMGRKMVNWIPIAIQKPLATGIDASGTFTGNPFDLGDVYTSRVYISLNSYGSRLNNYVINWSKLSDIDTLSGTDSKDYSVDVFYRIKNTESAKWSDWKKLIIGEVTFRYIQFRLFLVSNNPDVTPIVTKFEVVIDMPDRVAGESNVLCPTSGIRVEYSPDFYNVPAVGIMTKDVATGEYHVVSGANQSGFNIIFKNQIGVPVERQFSWIAKGYGKLQGT